MASRKKIDEQRFNSLKIVLNNLPKNINGLNKIYHALGIADSTAGYIRRFDTYQEYRDFQTKRLAKYPFDKNTSQTTTEVIEISHADTVKLDAILDMLVRIDNRLDEVFEQLNRVDVDKNLSGYRGGT
jgi:3-methyladenine DNA glycosylase/8-oxoguanine DNA glycosylase